MRRLSAFLGVYVTARLTTCSANSSSILLTILVCLGCATAVAGAWAGLCQTDLKRVIAFSTWWLLAVFCATV